MITALAIFNGCIIGYNLFCLVAMGPPLPIAFLNVVAIAASSYSIAISLP